MVQSVFRTLETGEEILRELYAKSPEEKLFQISLVVVVATSDSVDDMPLRIFVERLGDTPEAYQHPNGSLVFETLAYVDADGESFPISITPPIGVAHLESATVTASPEMEAVIGRHNAKSAS